MSGQAQVTVVYPGGQEVKIWTLKGKTARETLTLAGMEVNGSCGGRGTCGKCKVRIEGQINKLTDFEREHLLPEELKRGERIACYCTIQGDTTIWLDYITRKDAIGPALKSAVSAAEPTTYCKAIFIPGRDKENPVPILERLRTALAPLTLELSRENLNHLARLDRTGRPALELCALVVENRVKYVGRERQQVYGLALDIGTTSLLAALVNLEDGQIAGVCSQANMQRVYGENVLSRVSYCLENQDGLSRLQQVIVNNINSMIADLTRSSGTLSRNIYRISVVGNPVMLHIFLGLDISGFAMVPYGGIFTSELVYQAGELGLEVNPQAEAVILPQAGSFVGADTIAGLLAIPAPASKRYFMIDVGTNGELVLNDRGKMWAASAAAGPAFEGEGITCGMRASQGAIDKVWLEKGVLHYHVIGDERPQGICGSAVIGLMAALMEAGCLDPNGTLHPNPGTAIIINTSDAGPEVVLAEKEKTYNGLPLVFNQEDIRQVQLAKAAIRTGIDILLHTAGLNWKDLDYIYLAGAFGNYLDPASCIDIGMLPPLDKNKITNIGNAAAQGAVLALTSDTKRAQACALSNNIKCIELANVKNFQDSFMKNINLPIWNTL